MTQEAIRWYTSTTANAFNKNAIFRQCHCSRFAIYSSFTPNEKHSPYFQWWTSANCQIPKNNDLGSRETGQSWVWVEVLLQQACHTCVSNLTSAFKLTPLAQALHMCSETVGRVCSRRKQDISFTATHWYLTRFLYFLGHDEAKGTWRHSLLHW